MILISRPDFETWDFSGVFKGQLISKGIFGVIVWTKERSNQKKQSNFHYSFLKKESAIIVLIRPFFRGWGRNP